MIVSARRPCWEIAFLVHPVPKVILFRTPTTFRCRSRVLPTFPLPVAMISISFGWRQVLRGPGRGRFHPVLPGKPLLMEPVDLVGTVAGMTVKMNMLFHLTCVIHCNVTLPGCVLAPRCYDLEAVFTTDEPGGLRALRDDVQCRRRAKMGTVRLLDG